MARALVSWRGRKCHRRDGDPPWQVAGGVPAAVRAGCETFEVLVSSRGSGDRGHGAFDASTTAELNMISTRRGGVCPTKPPSFSALVNKGRTEARAFDRRDGDECDDAVVTTVAASSSSCTSGSRRRWARGSGAAQSDPSWFGRCDLYRRRPIHLTQHYRASDEYLPLPPPSPRLSNVHQHPH